MTSRGDGVCNLSASPSGPSTSTATDDRSAHGRVAAFLGILAGEKKHSESRLRQLLVQKRNERNRKMALKRKQKERIKSMVQTLQTTEQEILSLEAEIDGIKKEMENDSMEVDNPM